MTYKCRKCGKTITFYPANLDNDIEIMMDLASWGWLFNKKYGFICPDCVKEEKMKGEHCETGEPFRAIRYSTTFNIQVQAETWEFGDGEITFSHNDGTVIRYTIQKNRKTFTNK